MTVRTSAKVMSVRCGEGILKDDPSIALKPPFNEDIADSSRATPPSSGVKFEAKWKFYGTTASLPPHSQRLLLVMSPRGYQSRAGRIVFDAGELAYQPRQLRQRLIPSMLGGACGGPSDDDFAPNGVFDIQPLDKGFLWKEGRPAVDDRMQVAMEQSIMQAAIDQSKAEEQLLRVMQQAQEEEEARQLQLALAVSQQEDRELQAVMQRSRASHSLAQLAVVEILSSDDDGDIAVIPSRDNEDDCSSLYAMGFAKGVTAQRISLNTRALYSRCFSHSCNLSSRCRQRHSSHFWQLGRGAGAVAEFY